MDIASYKHKMNSIVNDNWLEQRPDIVALIHWYGERMALRRDTQSRFCKDGQHFDNKKWTEQWAEHTHGQEE